jgi:hypothetical protein
MSSSYVWLFIRQDAIQGVLGLWTFHEAGPARVSHPGVTPLWFLAQGCILAHQGVASERLPVCHFCFHHYIDQPCAKE